MVKYRAFYVSFVKGDFFESRCFAYTPAVAQSIAKFSGYPMSEYVITPTEKIGIIWTDGKFPSLDVIDRVLEYLTHQLQSLDGFDRRI